MKLVRTAAFAVCAVVVLMAGTGAHAANFANTDPITINDFDAATPYPSTIAVSGVTNDVTDVNVTITGWSHTWPSDVDVLLVGPGGQKVMLMSDAGLNTPVDGVNVTFDDQATLPMSDAPIVSGSYRPTNHTDNICPDDLFPAPAPAGPYGTVLSAFNGQNANGTWSLYVRDDCEFDIGSISGGWSLSLRSCLLPEIVAITDQTPAGPIVASLLCT